MARFEPNQYEDHFSKLITLRQTGSVLEYQSKFERGLARVVALSQEKKVSCFVTRLKDSIRTDGQANQPTTLTMAIGLPKLFEGPDLAQRRGTTCERSLPTNAPRTNQDPNKRDIPTTTVTKITTKELTEIKKKGLCFHYNERYKLGHCKAKWEDEDGDVEMEIEDVNEETTPAISLHAMSRGQGPKTMRIWGALMGKSVVVLIDTRSTHNFISSRAAQQVNLHPNSYGKLEVMVAFGEKLSSFGKCSQVQLRLQKVPFIVDFFYFTSRRL